MTATIRVTDDTSPAELREAITHLAAKAHRCPDHWADRKAAMHESINEMLDMLERMPETEPCG